jgi:hypothetical protein
MALRTDCEALLISSRHLRAIQDVAEAYPVFLKKSIFISAFF